ncbi:MAG: hypothetical protein AAFO09_08215, partial [Pseudomonadota bacterium]
QVSWKRWYSSYLFHLQSISTLTLVLLLTGCSFLSMTESTASEKDNYYTIFSNLLGINENRLTFLELMRELPFLISSVCHRLNAFFGFEGKNTSGKASFTRENTIQFATHLSAKQAETCLAQFSQ